MIIKRQQSKRSRALAKGYIKNLSPHSLKRATMRRGKGWVSAFKRGFTSVPSDRKGVRNFRI